MKRLGIAEALREAIRQEMKRDERVFCIGEDIAIPGGWGGAFTVTLGLEKDFEEGKKNKNQPFELSDSYKRMDKGVFGRLLNKGIINLKEYEAIKVKKGKIYKAGQQMNKKQPRELIEA